MADHLLEQTLPTDKAEMAAYYQRGMAAAFAGEMAEDAFAIEAGELLRAGIAPEDVPAALASAIVDRHQEFVEEYLSGNVLTATNGQTAYARIAEYVAAGGMEMAEAEDALTAGSDARIFELQHMLGQAKRHGLLDVTDDAKEWQAEIDAREQGNRVVQASFQKAFIAASYRLDKIAQITEAGVHGHTVAEPRRDMHPKLAEALGIDPLEPPSRDQIANLLNGQKADGSDIGGKQKQRATTGLDAALGLAPKRAPTANEVSRVISGMRVDGKPVEGPSTETARSRFFELMGVGGGKEPTAEQQKNLIAGRMADGSAIDLRAYEQGVTATKSRIGYIDLTLSADKSLSVAWALAPTAAEQNIIAQAHRDAVSSTMEYIAGEIGQTRKGKAGAGGSELGDIAWITFDHYSARPTVEIPQTDTQGRSFTELLTVKMAGDPQIHTHVAVPNVVRTESGRIGSLDLDKLAGRVHEYGAYYQAHVATNLRRSGVDVVLDENTGAARLTAVPDHVRTAFSKRTRDGTAAAREYASDLGLDWDSLSSERKVGLLKEGTQKHKLAKTDGMSDDVREKFESAARKDDVGDFASWNRQATELGYSHRSVLRPDEIKPAQTQDERLERAYQVAMGLLDKVLQRRAKIDSQELREVAARGLVASGVEDAKDIDRVTRAFAKRGVKQNGTDTSLVWGDDVPVHGKQRVGVTTAQHVSQEQELVDLVRKASADRTGALSQKAISKAVTAREAMPVEKGGLRFADAHGKAQLDVIDKLGQGGRFAAAIGVAGAGKSALLTPLVDAWKADGRTVYGAALAWRQTDDLAGAGVERGYRAAVSVFLKQVTDGTVTPNARSVVIVDELGLIGTRQMLDLMRLQAKHGFQVVAVGDPRQGQSIEAGPVIPILAKALGEKGLPELLSTVRQQTERERETSLMFREGRAAEALEIKRADGTARIVPGGHREAVAHVAALWRERMDANAADPRYTLTVTAPTNSDARAIGAAIREQRRAMGSLGADFVRIQATDQAGASYDLPLAVGDRVRLFDRATAKFTEGTHGNIGNNGSVLEVLGIGAEGLTLRSAGGREGVVKWDTLRDRMSGRVRLSYGDAMTIDAAQGLTSSEHISAMPSGSKAVDAFKGYVAASRHRKATWIVTSDGAERQEIAGRRPLGDLRPLREVDVWENMGRNLSRTPEKSSALAFLERATNVRRGAVRDLQAGLQPAEQRTAEGKERTTLKGNLKTTRRSRRLEKVTEASKRQQARVRPKVHKAVKENAGKMRPVLDQARRAAAHAREQIGKAVDKQMARLRSGPRL